MGRSFQFGPIVYLFVAVFIRDMPSVLAGCIIAFSLFTAIACVKNKQSFRRESQQKGWVCWPLSPLRMVWFVFIPDCLRPKPWIFPLRQGCSIIFHGDMTLSYKCVGLHAWDSWPVGCRLDLATWDVLPLITSACLVSGRDSTQCCGLNSAMYHCLSNSSSFLDPSLWSLMG